MSEEIEGGPIAVGRGDIDAYCIDMLEQIAVLQDHQRPKLGHQIRTCSVELAALVTRPTPRQAGPPS